MGRALSAAKKAVLMEARQRGAVPFTEKRPSRNLGHGGEHDVELAEDGARVIKHTRDGRFGYTPALNQEGRIIGAAASAEQYISRIEEHEALFPTGLKIDGIHADSGGGLTVSQVYLHDSHPDAESVRDTLTKAGFQKTSLGSTVWFNPKTKHLINDAKTDNFRKTPAGEIVPVDLQVAKVEPDSALHKALIGSLSK